MDEPHFGKTPFGIIVSPLSGRENEIDRVNTRHCLCHNFKRKPFESPFPSTEHSWRSCATETKLELLLLSVPCAYDANVQPNMSSRVADDPVLGPVNIPGLIAFKI
ncbi:hypothetical protein JEQ12_017142 [Ovis aries]|uniref:Uncharacterized protein n=1 Tax=Ovis aries TaxID=9940 RepID=A0A836A4K4_SHEEP|nr:hypothetical protein JEQ12_017142 [Ovis aries]